MKLGIWGKASPMLASVAQYFGRKKKSQDVPDNATRRGSFDIPLKAGIKSLRSAVLKRGISMPTTSSEGSTPGRKRNSGVPAIVVTDCSTTAPKVAAIDSLPSALILKIFQNLPSENLPTLLGVNVRFRKLVLNNYHLLLSYPTTITSKYEFCPLSLIFPWHFDSQVSQFYNALYRVCIYRDCFLVAAEELTNAYFGFWKSLQSPNLRRYYREHILMVGQEAVRDEILARLIGLVWRRAPIEEHVLDYTGWLVPDIYSDLYEEAVRRYSIGVQSGGLEGMSDRDDTSSSSGSYSRATMFEDENDDLFEDISARQSDHMSACETNLLIQSLRFAIHPSIREEISYSFPRTSLEALHPVQMLALMRVKTPPWGWGQEDQVEELKKMYGESAGALEQMEKYREEWERMREEVNSIMKAGPVR
ncbi:hypothetical protein ABW19_dt0202611 [Dactylella cylindrospora]|nr:hypothetical protein ABW19_dt0202611 [Dactylella cylindrospora]